MTSTPEVRISSRLVSVSRSATRTAHLWGLLSRALAEGVWTKARAFTIVRDPAVPRKALRFRRKPRSTRRRARRRDRPARAPSRGERDLRGLRETRPKFAVFDRGVQRAPPAGSGWPGRAGSRCRPRARARAALAGASRAHGEHEKRHVLDPEVAPIVAVVQDEAAVVRVSIDPGSERARHAGVPHALAVMPKAAIAIEHDRALARATFGRRQAEETPG